jgi:5-methylcytosine-specific restriction endonuclease McrA
MSSKKSQSNSGELEHILAEARELRARRGNVYRDQALKILPWICAWCGREFASKKLHELTVHHKDHNHNNNPSDGSNWELLCMYCHDSEHSRSLDQAASGETAVHDEEEPPATYNPFADLKKLVTNKE